MLTSMTKVFYHMVPHRAGQRSSRIKITTQLVLQTEKELKHQYIVKYRGENV